MKTWLRKHRSLVGTIIVVLILSSLFSVAASSFFTIKNIVVVGDGSLTVEVDDDNIEHNLLFFPTEQTEKGLLDMNPQLARVSIRKQFPSTLVIDAESRSPIVRLTTGNGESFEVSRDAIVVHIGETTSSLIPVAIAVGPLAVGQQIADERVLAAIEFISHTQGYLLTRRVSEIDTGGLWAETQETNIFFPQNKDLAGRLSTLQTLIAGFRIKGQMPTRIDLRFDKPIIIE